MKSGGGILAAAALAMASAYADDVSISATAANTISVDSRSGEVRTVAPCAIGYSPTWCDVTNEDAHVVLYKVEHAGMFNAVTNEVMTFSAGAEDDYSYSPAADGAKCVQLIHRVFTSGDEEIGTPLVRDVSFGFAATAGGSAAVDSRDGLLQRVVDVDGSAGFTYDTSWTNDAASVAISLTQLENDKHEAVPAATQTIFTATADASGVLAHSHFATGTWRFLLTLLDSEGEALGDPLSADYFKKGAGFFLIVR